MKEQQAEQDKPIEIADAGPGRQLRALREQQGLALPEVARRLRLPVRTIEQLESGQMERIGSAYRRGYVASYARLLGLDPGPLLDRLGPAESQPLRPVLPVRRTGQHWGRALNFATYAMVSVAIVAPLVYFFVLGGARLFESELAGAARTGSDSMPSAGIQPPGYRDRIADALSLTSAADSERDERHLSASALPLSALRPLEPGSRPASAPGPVESGEVPSNPVASLRLELAGDSWIEVEDARGERLEFDLLRAGTTREYSGRAPFRLLLGRASVVSIQLDGQPVAFTGADRAGVAETVIDYPEPQTDTEAGSVSPLVEQN